MQSNVIQLPTASVVKPTFALEELSTEALLQLAEAAGYEAIGSTQPLWNELYRRAAELDRLRMQYSAVDVRAYATALWTMLRRAFKEPTKIRKRVKQHLRRGGTPEQLVFEIEDMRNTALALLPEVYAAVTALAVARQMHATAGRLKREASMLEYAALDLELADAGAPLAGDQYD